MGVGLIVAFLAWPRREGSPLRPGPRDGVFGPYLRIAIDGRVTLAVPQTEVGQGIWTGLAQIAADELGAAWENMAVEPAPHGRLCQSTVARDMASPPGYRRLQLDPRVRLPLREGAAAPAPCCAPRRRRDGGQCRRMRQRRRFVSMRQAYGLWRSFGRAALWSHRIGRYFARGTRKLVGEALPRLDWAPRPRDVRFAGDVRLPPCCSHRCDSTAWFNCRFDALPQAAGRLRTLVSAKLFGAVGQSWWARMGRWHALIRLSRRARFGQHCVRCASGRTAGSGTATGCRAVTIRLDRRSRPLSAIYAIAATPHILSSPGGGRPLRRYRSKWDGTQVPDLARSAAQSGRDRGREVTSMLCRWRRSGRRLRSKCGYGCQFAKAVGRPVSGSFPTSDRAAPRPVRRRSGKLRRARPEARQRVERTDRRLTGLEATLARWMGRRARLTRSRPAAAHGIRAIRIDSVDADIPIRAGYMLGGEQAMMCFLTELIDEMARAMGPSPWVKTSLCSSARRVLLARLTTAARSWLGRQARGSTWGWPARRHAALSTVVEAFGAVSDRL